VTCGATEAMIAAMTGCVDPSRTGSPGGGPARSVMPPSFRAAVHQGHPAEQAELRAESNNLDDRLKQLPDALDTSNLDHVLQALRANPDGPRRALQTVKHLASPPAVPASLARQAIGRMPEPPAHGE
jgi:hypothetical protein